MSCDDRVLTPTRATYTAAGPVPTTSSKSDSSSSEDDSFAAQKRDMIGASLLLE